MLLIITADTVRVIKSMIDTSFASMMKSIGLYVTNLIRSDNTYLMLLFLDRLQLSQQSNVYRKSIKHIVQNIANLCIFHIINDWRGNGRRLQSFQLRIVANRIRTLGGIGPHIIHGVISLQNNMNLTFLHFFSLSRHLKTQLSMIKRQIKIKPDQVFFNFIIITFWNTFFVKYRKI